MDDDARAEAGAAPRYRAFMSYSHADAGLVRRLHRRLEAYRVPKRLVGRPVRAGVVPSRLAPVFRDRDELAAAHDLTAEVRTALSASECLIVICSPAAAASRWVNREIELFRELHPGRPVLAALVGGDPDSAFPPALRAAGGRTIEPLAADFRRGGDGARPALLKLVAGILGIDFDELARRDAQRRLRAVTAVTLVSVLAVIAMGVLTAFALRARAEAERQRHEAEGLVEFMLTDLRTRLKGVGRLDVLGAVNDRALAYYEGQDLGALPPASVERRARLFHAMGEDDERRGRLDLALGKWREAHRATAALLARDPDHPERIFAHAQSEYWLGYADYRQGRAGAALPAFEAYKRLADRLLELAPSNADYRREAGYAEGNLCTLALEGKADAARALRACRAALRHMTAAAAVLPANQRASVDADLANRHAWLADAYSAAGDRRRAAAEYAAQQAIVERLIAEDPRNLELRDTWVTIQFTAAARERRDGQPARAQARLERAARTIDAMIAFDPANDLWRRRRARIDRELSRLPASTE